MRIISFNPNISGYVLASFQDEWNFQDEEPEINHTKSKCIVFARSTSTRAHARSYIVLSHYHPFVDNRQIISIQLYHQSDNRHLQITFIA